MSMLFLFTQPLVIEAVWYRQNKGANVRRPTTVDLFRGHCQRGCFSPFCAETTAIEAEAAPWTGSFSVVVVSAQNGEQQPLWQRPRKELSKKERRRRRKSSFNVVVIQYTTRCNYNFCNYNNMVSHRTKRILRYLGPFLFFVGLAYTALYPERKLLHYTNQEEKATTLFNSGSVTVKDEIPLASCRVSESFIFL